MSLEDNDYTNYLNNFHDRATKKDSFKKVDNEATSTNAGHNASMEFSFKQVLITSEIYRYLMVMSAFLVCLSHGSNDVANAISPLVILLNHENYQTWISFFIGASGIALGLLIMGKKVMETVGKDIIILDF